MPSRVVVDDDEQIIADLLKVQRRHRATLAAQTPIWLPGPTLDPDAFTLTSSTDDTHALTYLPLGLNGVSLNGIGLSYGSDFTFDWTDGVVTLLCDIVAGDTLEVWYVTTGELIAATLPPEVLSSYQVSSNKAAVVGAYNTSAIIDTGAAFADIAGDLVAGTGGTAESCLIFGNAGPPRPSTADQESLVLRCAPGGAAGLYHATRIAGVDTDNLVQTIALGTSGTVAASWDGTHLTVDLNGSTVATITLSAPLAALLSRTWVGVRGSTGTGSTVDNFTANSGAVTDSFNRPDDINLGVADTGQTWVCS